MFKLELISEEVDIIAKLFNLFAELTILNYLWSVSTSRNSFT